SRRRFRLLCPANSLVLPRPFPVAQPELLDLAGRGFRQWPELDAVRAFVVCQALAAERDDLFGGRGGGAVQCEERCRRLAAVRVRDPDDRAFEYGGMGGDSLLDFDAGNVFAAGDDDVLAAITQFDVPVGVPHS